MRMTRMGAVGARTPSMRGSRQVVCCAGVVTKMCRHGLGQRSSSKSSWTAGQGFPTAREAWHGGQSPGTGGTAEKTHTRWNLPEFCLLVEVQRWRQLRGGWTASSELSRRKRLYRRPREPQNRNTTKDPTTSPKSTCNPLTNGMEATPQKGDRASGKMGSRWPKDQPRGEAVMSSPSGFSSTFTIWTHLMACTTLQRSSVCGDILLHKPSAKNAFVCRVVEREASARWVARGREAAVSFWMQALPADPCKVER